MSNKTKMFSLLLGDEAQDFVNSIKDDSPDGIVKLFDEITILNGNCIEGIYFNKEIQKFVVFALYKNGDFFSEEFSTKTKALNWILN